MREPEVVRLVAEALKAGGLLGLTVRYRGPGPDIEGDLPRSGRHLFVEAKGVRARTSPRVAVGEALLQVLSRWDTDVVCAVAVPYTQEFENVLRDILPGIRRLGLHLLLARPQGIWHLHPEARGFLPERAASLVEALDRP